MRSGDLFLFVNRRLNLTQTLYFEAIGYVILYKRRLEGRFPRLWDRDVVDPTGIRLSGAELALFLDGCRLMS